MTKTAIRFEHVSKEFHLSRLRVRSFQEIFVNMFDREARRRQQFWALQDVSFEVKQGETVAVLGVNGSGKSTILKLISRIIEPTRGVITVGGRMSALLELGAGFHPDLTGRENIYLNGSILGFSRAAMRRRLDSIIDFADIGDFIDVPIRNYSSGMQMRLGFSVAVHVEPEIMLVDEVLAVGDYNFQQKCLRRIGQMQQDGVSILFVSHDFEAVERLCTRAVWLEHGQVQADGVTADVLGRMRRRYQWEENSQAVATGQRLLV